MSDAIPPSSSSSPSAGAASSGEASWLWQLLTTPVSEVARGRVAASVSPERLAARSALPAPLAALVLDVAKRSRLWRVERTEIARELIAHFSDGLEAGRSPEQLISDFGDASQAARLLRRAAKRNRPWPWRAMRFTIRATAATLLLLIALYGVMAVRFYLGRPGPIIDYRPELNAAALAVHDDDKAWPLYREALLRLPAKRVDEALLGPGTLSRMPLPGEDGWDEVEAWLAQAGPAIDFAREVADKPGLGLVVGYPMSTEDAAVWPGTDTATDLDITSPESNGMIGILLPHLNSLRNLAMALGWDVQRAAAAGNSETVVADLRAMLAISRHVRETPLIINDLVGISIFSIARDRLDWILLTRPELLSDEQLITLAHALAAMDDRALAIDLSGERTAFKDMLQRLYTDDGDGDGRLTPRGLRWFDMLTSYNPNDDDAQIIDALTNFGGPALGAVVLGRRDMAAAHQRLMDMMDAEIATPLWEREASRAEQILEEWMASPIERVRHLPLCLRMPALGKATINAEFACMRRDATITAIALELYRRKHGAWPESLAQLVPATMPALPIDRFDGRTLRYRVKEGKPLLYSVGTDREDDGGVLPRLQNPNSGSAQWYSQHWLPRSRVQSMNQHPTIVGPNGERGPMYDGDWVLWPPLPESPLKVDAATSP